MALSSAAMAQENIEKAFEALRFDEAQEETMSSHHVDKAPETGVMEGMSDVYEFKITNVNVASRQLIIDVRNAFTKDREAAYSMSSGTNGGAETYTSLAVGDGSGGGVAIGLMENSKWMYACFLDPADENQNYRYAYGFEWVEKNDGTITGRMVKTYALTQKSRQSKKQWRSIRINRNGKTINVGDQSFSFGSGFPFDNSSVFDTDSVFFPFDNSSVFDTDSVFFSHERSSESWLSEFNTYKRLFQKNPDGTAASHYATYIYKLCKNVSPLEDVEKNLVATEIEKLKKKTNDEFLQQLFDMSIERLKK